MGLDTVELLMAIEEEFGITIPNAEAAQVRTIGDLHQLILRLTETEARTPAAAAVWERVVTVVAAEMAIPTDRVTPDACFAEDLGIDRWDRPPETPGGKLRFRALQLLLGAVLVAFAGWLVFGAYTGDEVRECRALYAEARTGADTTAVDLTVTPAARKHAEPRSCGFMRMSARWQ